jgi:hypothetical protein
LNQKAHYEQEGKVDIVKFAFAMNETNNRGPDRLKELFEFIGGGDIKIIF